MLGLEMQYRLEADRLVGKRFLDLREQGAPAVEELDGLLELVDQLALDVLQSPGQADDAGMGDEHRRMIAQASFHRAKMPDGHRPRHASARRSDAPGLHAPALAEKAA